MPYALISPKVYYTEVVAQGETLPFAIVGFNERIDKSEL